MNDYCKLLAAALLFSPSCIAQKKQAPAPVPVKAEEVRPVAASGSIASKTQGMKKSEGYFNYYYDDKTGRIFLEVDKLDREFLYFSSLPTGVGANGIERGQSASSIVKFIRTGAKILLITPNYDYRSVTGSLDEQAAIEDAFAKSVIWGFRPEAADSNRVLIDLTPFLIRDCLKIGDRLGTPNRGVGLPPARGGATPQGSPYRMDETRSALYMANTRNFPKNTEFEAMITLASTGNAAGATRSFAPDPSAVTVRMHQAFIELPDNQYKPRKFDPRSGMNAFSYLDFSAPMSEEIVKRYSRRHRLQKKDPAAAVSEPVKPIVYYVDRGAPDAIKRALIEGGSWWNQAFEAAGFKNAFQVKELPVGADPMDIRYNMVNWIARSGNPRAFSYGSSYIDPRTGEIIKGVVTLGSDRHRQDYLIAEGLLQPYEDGKPVSDKMEQLALARIRQLSAHEIGHTLGFYHNFAASIKDRASVMDYPFPRFTLQKDGTIDVSDAYAKGIGSWDKRSVMWGYTEFPAGTDENTALDKIMQATLAQGFLFIPDVGGGAHPLSHQWDEGVNAVNELNRLMAVRRHVLDHFSEKAIRNDAPMATLEEVLVPMYLLHRYEVEAAAKSLGGLYFSPAVKDDGQVITKMVEPAEQWKALSALINTVTPAALALPESLIGKIPPRPSGYPGSIETFSGHTGPTFDPLAVAETAAGNTLSYLLDPERAARLVEYHARDSRQPGLMPVLDQLLLKTWKAPLAAGYKGQLQAMVNNVTLKYLLQLAANSQTSEIVRGQALLKVNELKRWMQAKQSGSAADQRANLLFGLSQITVFENNPDRFQPAPPLDMPPGAPIGMPDEIFEP